MQDLGLAAARAQAPHPDQRRRGVLAGLSGGALSGGDGASGGCLGARRPSRRHIPSLQHIASRGRGQYPRRGQLRRGQPGRGVAEGSGCRGIHRLERGAQLGGVEGERVEGPARVAQAQRGERRDGQPHAHRVQVVGAGAQNLVDRPVGDGAAVVVEHDDAVGDPHDGVEVVLDQHERPVARGDEFAEGRVDLFDALRIEVRGRLVEHEQRRPHREGARDREALPPSARESVGVLGAALPQAHAAERIFGACEHLVDGQAQVLGPERDLVEQCAGDQLRVGVLEHHADVRAQLGDRGHGRVDPVDQHRPLNGRRHRVRNEPVERERQRRLAGPARTEQQHHLAARDVEARRGGRRVRRTVVTDAEVTNPREWRGRLAGGCRGGRFDDGRGHGFSQRSEQWSHPRLAEPNLPGQSRLTPRPARLSARCPAGRRPRAAATRRSRGRPRSTRPARTPTMRGTRSAPRSAARSGARRRRPRRRRARR